MGTRMKKRKISIGNIASGIIYVYDDNSNRAYFSNIFVSNEYRGYGFGNLILETLEKVATQFGYKSFLLQVQKKTDTHQWYKRKGYMDYYPNMQDNSYIWMKKTLKQQMSNEKD